jgi:hypothetical protein
MHGGALQKRIEVSGMASSQHREHSFFDLFILIAQEF